LVLSRWNIRRKLTVCLALLLVATLTLAIGGFTNVYAFRGVVKSISRRASELPMAVTLAQHVSALRATLPSKQLPEGDLPGNMVEPSVGSPLMSLEFEGHLSDVHQSLRGYRQRLEENASEHGRIGDIQHEMRTVHEMETTLKRIDSLKHKPEDDWLLRDEHLREELRAQVERLNQMAEKLPSYLQERMYALQGDVRGHYRFWIVATWFMSLAAGLLLLVLGRLFYRWVIRPLQCLLHGSRRVAGGDFHHRTYLGSGDEMEELADALNQMTERFQQIRDDLDEQVRQRTREVIRGEQLASVGFLAAGVAHEINNPLASIALCAESLEQQLPDWFPAPGDRTGEEDDEALGVAGEDRHMTACHSSSASLDASRELVQDYLRMIQEEAFRCKSITERLLDFSRLGDREKHPTELRDLVQGVIDMVRHVGKYRQKQIDFHGDETIEAPVNPQEFKQVVLNLITNGLESLNPGGTVRLRLFACRESAVLEVTDNGCGMTDEVKAHLFEPFFTRRKDGQGTGLGMSISYRIINEHGGSIEVHSDGPGTGSRFTIRLPLEARPQTPAIQKEIPHRHQAA
jgi:signal transduction histidine kinase